MQTLRQDLSYALRQLAKNPGFTLVTLMTLALGIGANTSIFSVVHGVLLRPLPFEEGERLVHIGRRDSGEGGEGVTFSVQEYFDFKEQNHTFAGLAEYHSMAFTLLGSGEPDRVPTGVVSSNFFYELGVKPLLGRTLRPADELPGADQVLILTYGYWRERFGSDPGILGKKLEMNGRPIEVVGVLPPLPDYPEEDKVFMATASCPFRSSERAIHNGDVRTLRFFGRLRPGVTLEEAETDLATIAGRMRQEFPEFYPEQRDNSVPVIAVEEELTGRARPVLLILLGTVGLVLLIACANVANLTLSRLIRREREMVVRIALGAGRGRLIRQLLTEGLLLSLAGGLLALAVAHTGRSLLVTFAQRFTPRAGEIEIDGTVLLFTLGVSVVTGLMFGLIPAFQASRQDLAVALREAGSKTSGGARGNRFHSALVVAQVAISFVVLVVAGLAIRSLMNLRQVDPGFNPENVLSLTIELPFSKYGSRPEILSFYEPLLDKVTQFPGVVSAALSTDLPLEGRVGTPGFLIEGRPIPPGELEPQADVHIVSEDYFRTVGVPLVQGRIFSPADNLDSPSVAIVNQTLARRHWRDRSPIGDRIALSGGNPDDWRTIVGVVGDVKHDGLNEGAEPAFYFPFRQRAGFEMQLLVRATSEPAGLVQDVRGAVREIDPDQPVANIQTLADVYSRALAPSRLTATLLGLFAGLAFVITTLGVSGVVTSSVTERLREIGIRSALGAGRGELVALVLRRGTALVIAGLVLGLGGSLLLTRLLSSLLFGIEPTDPGTFVAVSAVFLIIVGVACFVPARRAAGVDPIVVLRTE